MGEHPWKPGRVLAGRYRLELRLGEGGMGSIWRAQHLVLAAPVAVKLIDPKVAGDEDMIARFMREAQAAATLRSPHVVQIIDYGMDGLVPFMVMELLEGETLAERIKHVGRLSALETVSIVTQIARAVQRAHDAGIVHRDLKPENVFLVRNEDEEVAKVLDFGVAKVNQSSLGPSGARTKTGSILGTPFYMSPEQAQGNKAVDHRSDLWSLAVIVFQMLTGKQPFHSEGLGDLVLQICVRDIPVPSQFASLPPAFDAWFLRATARDPELRFQSARELADTLREALGIEGRETMGTLPDAIEQAAQRSRIIEAGRDQAIRESRDDDDTSRPSRAPTVLVSGGNQLTPASDEEAPAIGQQQSLTVEQFGTTTKTPLPKKTSSAPLVLGVAGGALVFGLVAGLALLHYRGRGNDPNRPLPVGLLSPTSAAPPEPTPRVSEPAQAFIDAALGPADAASAKDARKAGAPESAGRIEPQSKEGNKFDAAASGVPVEGGWTKPDWARPEDEPPTKTTDPDPPPPAPGLSP